jgi:class 3 adenylate cyclase
LITPKERRDIVSQLKRLKGFYGKTFSLTPLYKTIKKLRKIKTKTKKKYLIKFLKSFARYHRDLQNFNMLKEAMSGINLASEEKVINLSRINRTLYEFLLPYERGVEEKPIINHVVIKADVRGSTDITYRMKEGGLNPASYFSLNFFDPITEILSEYGAIKEFIEGNAIILSIFEHEDTPGGWYSVARACGLAINMLFIVQQYNAKSKKYQLPILELGIGIGYHNSPPAFLFDGGNRIMISSAINLADRLSGCTKSLRKRVFKDKEPFNLGVFQIASEDEITATADDLFLRYNVDGIELSFAGFEKLKEEIDLKVLECTVPDLRKEKIKIYTGKFPTVTGKYQRLVIREVQIPKVSPGDLNVIELTPRKYYEVCTQPWLYEYVKNK